MHRCIPKSELLDWIENVRQFLEAVSVGDHIPTGCACSGTGIWSHVNHTLALYWHEEFNLPMKEYQHKWMCEIDAEKRGFLFSQHHLEALYRDICTMAGDLDKASLSYCCISGRDQYPEWVSEYGAGFVSKDVSKQNSQRKHKPKWKLASGEGQTGSTYQGAKSWILKTRPFFSYLENVSDVLGDDADDDQADTDLSKAESKTIKNDFEGPNMTVISVVDDPRNKGSLCARARVYPLIINIPRPLADAYRVEEHFFELFLSLRSEEQMPFDNLMIEETICE